MNYKEAKIYAIKNNIKTASEWFKHSKVFKIYPSHPERTFINEWTNWYDFLTKENDERKFYVNDNFFKTETCDSAYILGFWAADGTIINDKIFSLTQNIKDEYILKNILKRMESNYKLNKHMVNNKKFDITSKNIVEDVKRIFNYNSNKTYNINLPSFKDNTLYSDFIRGFFDGDGCVTYQKNEKCYVSSIICANKSFLHNLFIKMKELIPNFLGKFSEIKGYYNISMGVNDTRRFRDFIYNTHSDLHLIRKKEKLINAGPIKIASFNKEFLNYDQAKTFIINIGIKKYKEWKKHKKENKIDNIPSNLEYYQEYTSWNNFINQK